MDRDVAARLKWVRLYEKLGDAGLVCRRCGISRPTLRKWVKRYSEKGIDGLQSMSRRPHSPPARKITKEIEDWTLDLRSSRNLGAQRIQNELARLHASRLSLATIYKVLKANQAKPSGKSRRGRKPKRYSRPIPGDRVQMDVCKIAPGKYQYIAVDGCTRCRVLALFPRRTAANTLKFIDQVIEEVPFPIQRFQTDRGREFFAVKVQKKLMEYGIKFRPIKPASPRLNSKVERSQTTDLDEFYAPVGLQDPELEDRLAEWQHYYNWHRAHGSLRGATPMDRYFELIRETPYWDDVSAQFDESRERIQEANHRLDLELKRLKRSL